MFNFLSPKINSFGIDLSDLSIKIAQFKKYQGGFCLTSFGRSEIKNGLIENGEIKNEPELIQTIKEAVQKVKGEALKTKYCVASLPEKISFLQIVKLPLMSAKELAEAIKWELETHIPLSKDEVYYDWQVVNKKAEDHLDVLLGVMPKKTVDPYLSVLKKAGLKPLVFEIEPVATARALIKNSCSDNPLIIVDLGAKRTSLFIFYGQAIYFTIELPVNSSMIVDALSQNLNISQDKALQIKMKVGLNMTHPRSRVYKEIQPLLLTLVEKIKAYIVFYNEHLRSVHGDNKDIERIILCGGGALMKELPEFLSGELSLSVEIGNPWVNINDNSNEKNLNFPQKEALSFTTVFGLAIQNSAEQ